MDMRFSKRLLLALTLCLTLLLCGCRTRTTGSGQGNAFTEAASGRADETSTGEYSSDDSTFANASGNEKIFGEDSGEAGGPTRENPDASRKEYDEHAPAEIVPGTDRLLHEAGEGNGAGMAREEAQEHASHVNSQAEETAVQTVAAEDAEQTGVSEDAEAADSALTYFTVLLQDRMGSLFECQRLNAYWETEQDHMTIHKTAPEHSLILNAGCYDVSARLLPENLRVDDGWVVRKNPGVIIKIVDSSILGGGVTGSGAAEAISEALRNRDGWASIDAVKNGRILLLSRELLEAPYQQVAAMVMIARTANPSLFSDVDLDEMLRMLTEEATGSLPTGIFYYSKEERP